MATCKLPRPVLAILVLLAVQARPATALDLQLAGKTALVTGSTSGIGYATAKALLKEGATVIVNSNRRESVDRAVASLEAATGRTPASFVADMTKPADIAKLVAAFPRVDILVNNVGGMIPRPFEQTTDEDWYRSFDLNVMSGVRLSRAYLPGMKARNWGRIIFLSSESALQIPVESIQYGMSKAAVIAVARGLAEICAKTGVTVNSILPGPTMDPQDPRIAQMLKRSGGTFEQMQENFIRTRRPTSIIQRFARPDEVAALILYVASPLSSATTGAALRVDGGVVKSAF
ncbi:MAG TPA: SDR family oxidoreductase [Steroidobacteraceae bacterium]|nr:SDR family oxidoreductase [Steroidobacteraceae bacterium]